MRRDARRRAAARGAGARAAARARSRAASADRRRGRCSAPRSPSATREARAIAGPTDVRQAKSTFAGVIGWRRTSSMSTPGRTRWTAITIDLEVYHCGRAPLVLASSSPRRAELLQRGRAAASWSAPRRVDESRGTRTRRPTPTCGGWRWPRRAAAAAAPRRARARRRHGGRRRRRAPRQAGRRRRRRGDAAPARRPRARGADRRRAGPRRASRSRSTWRRTRGAPSRR